jgi:hypothetical protein
MSRRILPTVTRLLLALLGVVIFLTLIPHLTPWQLSNFSRISVDSTIYFLISIPLLPWTVRVTSGALFAGAALLLVLLFLALPREQLRSSWQSLRSNSRAFTAGMVALELFLITLIPSEPDFVRDGTSVIFFLVMNTIALGLIAVGIAPLVRVLFSQQSLSQRANEWFLRLRHVILHSNPIFFVGFLTVLSFVLASIVSDAIFERIPHVQDSIAQLFHGKILAAGALTAPAPPAEFFEFLHIIINDGKWYSQYPPGHSALLAAGVLVNAPWIVNPFFGSLTVIAAYALGKELFGETVGRLTAVLTLFSPFLLFMNSEFMNHTTALFFFTLFILFLAKALRTGAFSHGALAGATLGWLANIRPYSAPALALPFLLYGFMQVFKRWNSLKRAVGGFVCLFLVFILLLLGFNWLTNGNPFLFGFQVLWGDQVQPGFGHSAWGEPHTPLRGLHQTLSNLNGMNKYLFELPVPSLLLVILVFFSGTHTRWDLLFASTLFMLSGTYFFYWFQDWCFGPRFLFESSVPLIILAARGIDRFPGLWNSVLGFTTDRIKLRIITFAGLVSLFTAGFAINLPPHLRHYGYSYWGVNTDVLRAVERKGIEKGVVFVKSYFGSVLPANDPFLREGVIYAIDRGPKNKELMTRFPGLKAYKAKGEIIEELLLE